MKGSSGATVLGPKVHTNLRFERSAEELSAYSEASLRNMKDCIRSATEDTRHILHCAVEDRQGLQRNMIDVGKKSKTAINKQLKICEDIWGRSVTKSLRTDLTLDKQWTTTFGETLAKALIYLCHGKSCFKPVKRECHQPDWETDDYIVEVKTGTFYTGGTAHEKIPGVFFKYVDCPGLYSKPLKILCIGGAEKASREKNGNLPGEKCGENQKKLLAVYKELQMECISATELLMEFAGVTTYSV